ncbi:hypothetical protein IQ255_16780 [Pleurocapsales cyanobacterium LEGE 10410]|nr:hypothetical protein [Pleurocapsales cyanobacterium LEGE 10410]
MKNSSNELALLSLLHCLLGIFGIACLVILLYFLFGFSEDVSSFIFTTFLFIGAIIYFVCLFCSGIFMGQRKNYRFSLVVAWIGLVLLSIPTYGLMGIFGLITIFILTKDSVKVLYKTER